MSRSELFEAPALDVGALAAALAALRALLIAGKVVIRDLWQDHGSGPGSTTGRTVEVEVTDDPAALDALLRGMSHVEGPSEWTGNHYLFRDWRGVLLTMPVLLTQRAPFQPVVTVEPPPLPAPAGSAHGAPDFRTDDDPAPVAFPPPPAGADRQSYSCADHPDFVPDSLFHLRQHIETEHAEEIAGAHVQLRFGQSPAETDPEPVDPEPADPDACTCWATSRNGCPQHYIRDEELPEPALVRPYLRQGVDARPLLELALDERFGPDRGAPIETVEPVVIPGPVAPDPASAEVAWSRYARARAVHYFGNRRFENLETALEALRYWPGYDILLPGDAEIVAGVLVDPPRTPEPAPAAPRGLRRVFARTETAR